ncbi:MAG: hypothetical protein M0R46_13810 [Candidatus Muirbacterium halophilum]|nr:hypothetical protein [Candidatus Muirbacterium halophilum]
MKKYLNFINESTREDEELLNQIINLPYEVRKELKEELEDIKDEKTNEGLGSLFSKFKNFLSKKALDFIINLNEKEIDKKIELLTILDPTDLSPDALRVNSVSGIYLGGGIDKTKPDSESKEWREEVEDFFGSKNIVYDSEIAELGRTGKLNKSNYNKPLIFNPMRNELVREDPNWAEYHRMWREGEFDDIEPGSEEEAKWVDWSKITNTAINRPDRLIIQACDTNLVSLNAGAGGGTYGEIELTAYRNLNLFIWLNDAWTMKDISPWLIPSITKIVRTKEELFALLDAIKNHPSNKN